eukprot:jgi/Psemu1/192459/e_gw1.128.31.1
MDSSFWGSYQPLIERQQSVVYANANANANANGNQPRATEDKYNDDTESVPFRTWKPFDLTKNPFPCYPSGTKKEHRLMITKPAREGILFQRPTKVGSTTMTNIVLRLVHNRASKQFHSEMLALVQKQRNFNSTDTARMAYEQQELVRAWNHPPRCRHRTNHGTALDLEYSLRDKDRSFLFGLVRDPIQRTISEFFHFSVSVHQKEPTDENFLNFATRPLGSNSLIKDMTFRENLTEKITNEWSDFRKQPRPNDHDDGASSASARAESSLDYHEIVSEILDGYDFIAVMERMDESLVALKLLLGLTVEEILYVKASRAAGSFQNGPRPKRPCVYLVPSFLTPSMQAFFYHGTAWREFSKGDRLLHNAANKSLDATISKVFGKERFAKELFEFRNAQAYANAVCTSRPNLVVGMCDGAGHSITDDPNRNTTCYIWSEGCDHECLDLEVPNPLPRSVLDGTERWKGS